MAKHAHDKVPHGKALPMDPASQGRLRCHVHGMLKQGGNARRGLVSNDTTAAPP